jgi:flavin-dependent dehydrogenase
MNIASKYDIVIVGGGPAGSGAAIRLAQNGFSVLLVEKKKFPRAKLCGEFISPECLTHFEELGILDEVLSAGSVRLHETVFYARNGKGVSVPSEWFKSDSFALGLSRAKMDARLLMRAREVGVEVLEETQAVSLVIEDEKVCGVRLRNEIADSKLQMADGSIDIADCRLPVADLSKDKRQKTKTATDNGQRATDKQNFSINANITIDATGRTRILARRFEKKEKRKRADFVAFKTHLENARVPQDCCEIYVYRGGYGGCNRVEDNLYNFCFIASADDAKKFGSDAERVMREVVFTNKHAAESLKDARIIENWHAVVIESFGRGSLIPARGLLTIGDAAAFIDPFTGSGMLLALESAKIAANAITKNPNDFADEYQKQYSKTFDARLRVCSLLRHAAFVPFLAEATITVLSFSDSLRRRLVKATRQSEAIGIKR